MGIICSGKKQPVIFCGLVTVKENEKEEFFCDSQKYSLRQN